MRKFGNERLLFSTSLQFCKILTLPSTSQCDLSPRNRRHTNVLNERKAQFLSDRSTLFSKSSFETQSGNILLLISSLPSNLAICRSLQKTGEDSYVPSLPFTTTPHCKYFLLYFHLYQSSL